MALPTTCSDITNRDCIEALMIQQQDYIDEKFKGSFQWLLIVILIMSLVTVTILYVLLRRNNSTRGGFSAQLSEDTRDHCRYI